MYHLWDVFQQGQIDEASRDARNAKRDAERTDSKLRTEILRLESKIDNLAIIASIFTLNLIGSYR